MQKRSPLSPGPAFKFLTNIQQAVGALPTFVRTGFAGAMQVLAHAQQRIA